MSGVTERQILDALGHVADPDRGTDIVSLGMVSGLVIRDGNVAFAIEVERERGPQLEPLRKAADIALLDARKGLNMFKKVDVPVLGIVENMSYFLCPHCGGRSEIFSHGGARLEAERLGTEFLGEVPLDLRIRETSDGGAPITVSEPDNPHTLVFRRMAGRIWEKVAGPVPRSAAHRHPIGSGRSGRPSTAISSRHSRAESPLEV